MTSPRPELTPTPTPLSSTPTAASSNALSDGFSDAPPTETVWWRADGVLLAITAFWGITFVVVKDALASADAVSFLVLRFAVGGVTASALARRGTFSPAVLRDGSLLGLFLFFGYVFQTQGLVFTTPSRSAFITGLAAVFVPLLSALLFRRLPGWPPVVGIVIAMVGLYALTGGLSLPQSAQRSDELWMGDLLTLGCAVAFAFHIVVNEKVARRHPPLTLVSVQLWVTALGAAALWPFVETRVTFGAPLFWAVLVCGVLASAGAIGLQTWAQARTPAVHAAVIFSLEPAFAALYSAATGTEQLGLREWLGGGIIVLGVLVAELGSAFLERRGSAKVPQQRQT